MMFTRKSTSARMPGVQVVERDESGTDTVIRTLDSHKEADDFINEVRRPGRHKR